jgi:hypothetical protein
MTFGEAGTARTEIGSGLIYHGIPKVNVQITVISSNTDLI